MPARRKAVPPATEAMQVGTSEEIRARLNVFVNVKYGGNWSHFAKVVGVPLATVEEWKPAGRGMPSVEKLRLLAQQRLSLDWLFHGSGSMEWELIESRTDKGALLLALRPILQRLTEAGEMTAEEAFDRLILRRTNDELLELAAKGLLPLYREVERDITLRDEVTRISGDVYARLALLDKEASTGRASAVRSVVRELMAELKDYAPAYLTHEAEMWEQLRKDIDLVQRQASEARRLRWHEAAFATAAEVTLAVQDAKAAIEKVAEQARQPDQAVLQQLRAIETMLLLLVEVVRAQQSVQGVGPASG